MKHIVGRLGAARTEIAWVVAGQLSAAVAALVSIKLLTTLLGPEEYGRLALGLAIAGAVHLFLYGPIEQTVFRFASLAVERRQLGLCFRAVLATHARVAAAVVLVAGLTAASLHLAYQPGWSGLVLLAASLGLVVGIGATSTSWLTAWRERRVVAMHQAADAWLRLALALALVATAGALGTHALLGILCAAACVALSQGRVALRQVRGRIAAEQVTPPPVDVDERSVRSDMYRYALPFLAFAAFASIASYADRWLLLSWQDSAAVGVYAALLQLATAPVSLFMAITNQLVVPVLFNRAGAARGHDEMHGANRLARLLVWWYGAALSIGVLAAYWVAPVLVPILTNETFAAGSHLLWVLVLGAALVAIGQTMVLSGLAAVRPAIYVAPKAAHATALLVVASLAIPGSGIAGLAWATVAAGAIYVLTVHLANRRLRDPGGAGPGSALKAG